ncbi:MAG: NAD(P)H-binding protein, partial [Solimonas sp.]
MKIVLFGATGMVGAGTLRLCLQAADVEQVLVVGRTPVGQQHPKLRELLRADLHDYGDVEQQLAGYDACFFCLGVSSAGMSEADYTRITYDLTMAAATTLAGLNPQMSFIYVSGAGTDSSERGGSMWARVKGRTENALQALPFKAVYLFRPGVIQPLHG